MSFFSRQQIDEIQRLIAARAKRDSDFVSVFHLEDTDFIAFVRGNENVKISVQDFRSELADLFAGEITAALNTLTDAISSETERASTAELDLHNDISSESTARQQADGNLQTDIDNEAARAQEAEHGLAMLIDGLATVAETGDYNDLSNRPIAITDEQIDSLFTNSN